jgi:hypothetical protein
VFYTATDWLRLATKLAAAEAPCLEYYISIPPLAADKTQFRYAQPSLIHALGPNFHVLAEISTNGWGSWIAADGSRDWYQAGQEARRRMAAANFDVATGDSWIVNELSSAVVRGIGVARANMRQLVHGLYDGDAGPPVKGGVFTMLMLGLVTSSFSTYKAYLQDWYRDTPFWNDMAAYVRDWSQELYGDLRAYAVEGSSLLERREALDDYLQHELRLANAGPDAIGAARAFLRSAYSPLANAAWQYDSGFGWTAVPYEQMEDYVSAQTYALRSFAARSGQTLDRFGFAWAPKSPVGMRSSDYQAQSGAIADRLAAAIRDSAQNPDPTDPGAGACAPTGENVWCSTTVPGSAFDPAWKTFTSWSPDVLALLGAATATAGQPVPLTAELQVAGIAWPAATPVTATLASSSGGGELAPTVNGPWAATLDLAVSAGSTDATFYYRDTSAGTATLTANTPDRVGATFPLAVGAAALATLEISPTNVTVVSGGSQQFTASGADAYRNPVVPSPTWSVSAGTPGTISPSGLFAASENKAGAGAIISTADGVTATTSVVVAARARLPQTISFAAPAAKTYGDPDFTINATASSGLPVTVSANGNCTASSVTVQLTGAGSCTITASQAGDASYNAAPDVAMTIAIAKANQAISFAALANKQQGDPDFNVTASASSGLDVSFIANGDCTVSGATIHITGAGSCTLIATQAGDANYNAAPDVPMTFAIAKATQSKQPSKCVVPDVVGKPLASAKRMIERRHCRTGSTRYAYSRKTKKGIVIAQSRRPGRVLASKSRIALIIGRGPKR